MVYKIKKWISFATGDTPKGNMTQIARLFPAKTARIHTPDCIEAKIDLGFGITVDRRILVDGIYGKGSKLLGYDEAKHCMIVLIGGKKLLIETLDPPVHGPVRARVFLDEQINERAVGMSKPHGLDSPRLELSAFWAWLASRDFSVDDVRAVLNGKIGWEPGQSLT